jgi:hypothetical protein
MTLPRLSLWITLLSLTFLAASCRVTPYQRKLPEWVRRVYVPMALNKTTESGLEERVTHAFIQNLLEDGRVEPFQRGRADAVVKLTLVSYSSEPYVFTSDDVAADTALNLLVNLQLFEPNDLENPFAEARNVRASFGYNSNYRSTTAMTLTQAREHLSERAGQSLVDAMLNQVVLVEK